MSLKFSNTNSVPRFTQKETATGQQFSITDDTGREIFWVEVSSKSDGVTALPSVDDGEVSGLVFLAMGVPSDDECPDESVAVYTDAWVLEQFAMALLTALREA